MKTLSRRQKLVGGVFVIAATTWAIDMLSSNSGPSQAEAAPALTAPGGPTELPPDPVDLASLVEALQSERRPRIALPFEQAGRDLFVPTAQFETRLSRLSAHGLDESEKPDQSSPEPLSFDSRHNLQGVLMGRVPLALVDGLLLREGAEIDGYRLVEIRPDSVVFRQGHDQTVSLHVPSIADH